MLLVRLRQGGEFFWVGTKVFVEHHRDAVVSVLFVRLFSAHDLKHNDASVANNLEDLEVLEEFEVHIFEVRFFCVLQEVADVGFDFLELVLVSCNFLEGRSGDSAGSVWEETVALGWLPLHWCFKKVLEDNVRQAVKGWVAIVLHPEVTDVWPEKLEFFDDCRALVVEERDCVRQVGVV